MNLLEIGTKLGEVHAGVGQLKSSMDDLEAGQRDLALRVASMESQVATRRLRERLAWSAVTAVGVASWGLLGLIPGRVWVALAKALAGQ